jgi:hypothetical protein
MMYLIRAGMNISDVQWVESENSDEQFEALKSRRADARFISGARGLPRTRHAYPARSVADDQRADADHFLHGAAKKRGLARGWSKRSY